MATRKIIRIDEALCTGCGDCVPSCAEGAIAIVDGKAKLIAEKLCDGLGACLGECPEGALTVEEREVDDFDAAAAASGPIGSELRQWPVQLHLVSPTAPYFQKADVLLAADCVAFAVGDFHRQHLKGRALAVACPKLDGGQEIYLRKLVSMIDDAKINSLIVMVMDVPCCAGLVRLAKEAAAQAKRKVPVKQVTVAIQGGLILSEEWV